MRIALNFTGCHHRGGVERVLVECANFLAKQGHAIHVFASEIDSSVLDPTAQKHFVPPSSRVALMRLAGFSRAATSEIARLDPTPDVLGGFGVVGPPGAVVWVQSVHAAWLEVSNLHRGFGGRLKQRMNPFHPLILSMERSYFGERKYRRLIALTPQVKTDLMRFYAVPEEDIEVLSNGFAPNEFNIGRRSAARDEVRAQLGYCDIDQVVVFTANEMERKGFGPLLRGIASLERRNVHLLAVGRLNSSAYAAEIARLGMTNRVRFTGSTNDVAKHYACADIFALPTQYEAWGLVIVEAMACGLPVLTSRLAGAAIAVREGWSGELLDDPRSVEEIGGKLSRLLDGHHAEAAAIADSVAPYQWNRLLQKYEAILDHCSNKGMRTQQHVSAATGTITGVHG